MSGKDLETITRELPDKINKILDNTIDTQFMKRGFKASDMRKAILKALEDNDLQILQGIK